jgi:2-polyprenyl-3-methyl-5-hydroxy-6-metoxy-1,4-benzoquinol methylase
MNIVHDTTAIKNRADRYEFLKRHFEKEIKEATSILDVGCDDNFLKQIYGDKVFGIDIGGKPDRVVDLEKESLRFLADKSYDLSICTEVLEHIDNLHEVFRDIQRVTKHYMIISIPNSISYHRLNKIHKTHRTGKFYGLPLEKPVDRHKWYFSYREIVDFFAGHEKAGTYTIERVIYQYPIRYNGETRMLKKLKQSVIAAVVTGLGLKRHSSSVFVLLRTSQHES